MKTVTLTTHLIMDDMNPANAYHDHTSVLKPTHPHAEILHAIPNDEDPSSEGNIDLEGTYQLLDPTEPSNFV